MRSLRSKSGLTLVGVLVAFALLALSLTALMRFTRSMQKVAANRQKMIAVSQLQTSFRAVLGNRRSCLETFSPAHVAYATLASANPVEQRPFRVYESMGGGLAPRVAFAEGDFVNGVVVAELGLMVGQRTRNVHQVRVRALLRKVGDGLHQTDFEEKYYVHVLMNGNVPTECYLADGPNRLTLVKAEDVTIPATLANVTNGRASMIVSNPDTPPHPNMKYVAPGWDPLPSLPIPQLGCNAPMENGLPVCPTDTGPPSPPVVAQGNRLMFSFQTKVAWGINGAVVGQGDTSPYPLILNGSGMTPPGPYYYYDMDPMGVGAVVIFRLLNGATSIFQRGYGVSSWFGAFGFTQSAITSTLESVPVDFGTTYNFGMEFSSSVTKMSSPPNPHNPPPPPPPAIPPPPMPPAYSFYFINYFPAKGSVFHYVETPPLP